MLKTQFSVLSTQQPLAPSYYHHAFSTHNSLLWLSRAVLTATTDTVCNTSKVQCATDEVVSHTWAILTSSTSHENNAVLLNVVPFTGDVGGDLSTVRETHTSRFALARVGLLWTHNADLDAYAFETGGSDVRESGRDGVTSALAFAATPQDLPYRRILNRC